MPVEVEPLLDDIDVGELEGQTIDEYRAWKHGHGRGDAFPGGESLDAAALRYADAYERLLARPEQRILVVCHEIPVRYAINAAAGSEQLDGPGHEIRNCVPHLFDEDGLARAVARIRALTALTQVRPSRVVLSPACAFQTLFSPLCMYAYRAGESTR